jgi:cell division protein FtsI (penicillin-binding protein 3)
VRSRVGSGPRSGESGRTTTGARTGSAAGRSRTVTTRGGTARPGSTRATTSRPARPPRSVRTGGGPPRRPPRARLLRLGDPGRRLGVGFAAVCTLLVILGGRLVQLQGFDSDHLAASSEQKLLYPTTIPATRGQIVDRNGNPLAYSVTARTIFADPRTVVDPQATAAALAGPLKEPVTSLLPRLTKKDSQYVVLAKNLTPAQAADVLALGLRGIGADDTTQRIYPGNDLASAVIGYTNNDGGQSGIESKFNTLLRGTDGRLEVERGTNNLQIPGGVRQETPAVPGSNVQLTIDQDLQFQLQRALAGAVQKAKASSGQAVILNIHTGEVLAMATAPTFDAQNPRATKPEARLNLAVQAPVEPGSANKVVTFSAAVQDGKLRPDTPLLVNDAYPVPGAKPVHDAWVHGPAKWTATGVLAKSSNVGTLMIANQMVGPAKFYDTERRFGIGQKTGIELPGESGGWLPAPDTKDWSGSTFANLPIGQGLSMTPLQLAGMYQTIANDGVRIQPRIVKAVVNPDGSTTPTSAPQQVTVISPAAARTVRGMLEAVVGKGGTAPKAAIDNYRVAGKTGTAQRSNPKCNCYSGGGYWATFAGMAPADKPELVMSVVIEEPPGGGEGGSVAAPMFHDVMSYALAARKVTPTGTPVPVAKLTFD